MTRTGVKAAVLLAPLLFLSFLLRLPGLRGIGLLGRMLGALLYQVGFRRRIVRENIELALGKEMPAAEREALCRAVYRNVGLTFLEIARNFSLSREQMQAELYVSPEVRKKIDAVIARGKGAVFISGHCANWELFAMGMAIHYDSVAIVVKKMNNPVSQALIERQRLKTGLGVIYSGGTIEKMRAGLAQKMSIGFMVDPNTTGKKGIRANFFGVPASSIRGLSALVRDTGCAVMPICGFRQPDGRHVVCVLDELPYIESPEISDPAERRLREEYLNTQQYQDAVEKLIRRQPDQWLWIHRRWKADRRPLTPGREHLENQ